MYDFISQTPVLFLEAPGIDIQKLLEVIIYEAVELRRPGIAGPVYLIRPVPRDIIRRRIWQEKKSPSLTT